MKWFYLFCLLVLISFPIQAKNKISMVTYFPVPYVAYSQVNTTEQIDIGLTSACDMKLGGTESSATLNAAQVNLKGGKLNLDGGRGIKGYVLNLGNGSGEGKISFQNVRIQTGTMESVNAGEIKAANLNLFGKAFPSCKSANSESGGQMQWASLQLKGAASNELYLMCGPIGINTEKPCTKTRPDTSQVCNTCGRQFRTVNCDTSTGEWQVGEWSTCSGGTPSKLTEEQTCTFSKYSYKYHSLSDSPNTTITVSPPPMGKRTRTWNASSCSWGSWGPCTADIYVSLGPFTRDNKSYCKSDSVCNTGANSLNGSCTWPQSMGLSGKKCATSYGAGCYLYQCQRITEK
ncbi:MAG: hypothetical protein PUK24_06750 [Elusimicrobia bacterium]|nr:hypothetical protein [Elusimicrobiota bacterium]MDY6040021.1 hypothetical protein [Elusimicrobiaceae bacterium]